MIVVAPGGPEGAARAGALPTPEMLHYTSAPVSPTILPARAAPCAGCITVYAEPATTGSPMFGASDLELAPHAAVAEHVHAHESELLYVLAGTGTLTVAGVALAVGPTSVVQIPANTKHAFVVGDTSFSAVQVYTPAGPDHRFKK